MRISVVIPCYNSGEQLRRTVASALKQTLPPMEIVCVDDSSTDATWQTIQELEKSSGGVVRGIRHETRKGNPAYGRNTAIGAAKGDWIALLDHDDIWLPGKLEAQARRAKTNPEAGVIHTEGWMEDDDDPATRRLMHARVSAPEKNFYRACFHDNFVFNSSAMVRREWAERIGGLDTAPELLGVDDYDFWMRLARAGCVFGYVPEPLAIWRCHGGNLSGNETRRLKGCITVLERALKADPGLRTLMGPEAMRSRFLFLRLEVAQRLIRKGQFDEAREQLEKACAEGRAEPSMWGLRLKLALRKWDQRKTARHVRKVGKLFRNRAREARLLLQ